MKKFGVGNDRHEPRWKAENSLSVNCLKCGYTCADTDVVCPRCGVVLDSQPPYPPVSQQPPYIPYAPYPPRFYVPYTPPVTNNMAAASMVLGIYSIVLGIFCGGAVTSILAIVLGFVSLSSINGSYGREKGKGMAIAGIVCGFAALAIWALFAVIMFVGQSGSFSSSIQPDTIV